LQRFLREGAAAARVNHPSAIRVLDSGVSTEGVAFLIMELLEGHALAEEIRDGAQLPLGRCAAIGSNVAAVLAAAHRQGILHRDIKPDNVFLQRAGTREIVKVLDFGIAKFFGARHDTEVNRLTRTGELLGTPIFVAPERLAGGADDGRSDVFSLGAMLYEMICAASPWTPEQQMRMSLGLCRDSQPTPMECHRAGVPEALEALVRQALTWDASGRPTAQDFAAAVARLAGDLDESSVDLPAGESPGLLPVM
jgi:serine/threonine protein kinase